MRGRVFAALGVAAVLLTAAWALNYLLAGMDTAEVVRKLSGLRLSIELYRQEQKALPASFEDTLRVGTLEAAPVLKLPGHFRSSRVRDTPSMIIKDTGGWAYVNNPKDPNFGLLYIDCSHKDPKARFWSEF